MHRPVPHQRILRCQLSIVLRFKKPGLDIVSQVLPSFLSLWLIWSKISSRRIQYLSLCLSKPDLGTNQLGLCPTWAGSKPVWKVCEWSYASPIPFSAFTCITTLTIGTMVGCKHGSLTPEPEPYLILQHQALCIARGRCSINIYYIKLD